MFEQIFQLKYEDALDVVALKFNRQWNNSLGERKTKKILFGMDIYRTLGDSFHFNVLGYESHVTRFKHYCAILIF
jgi:hypothetical protein